MGKFITLTYAYNSQPILVNVDRIVSVHQDCTLKTETTYIEQDGNSLAVKESLESVANLIRRAEKTDNDCYRVTWQMVHWLMEELHVKTELITDCEGLQHEVCHSDDVKEALERFYNKWKDRTEMSRGTIYNAETGAVER